MPDATHSQHLDECSFPDVPKMQTVTPLKSRKTDDTVGQPPSTEIGVLNMSSWKAKKLKKFPQEKVLLEL
jgi:hypothetical protein